MLNDKNVDQLNKTAIEQCLNKIMLKQNIKTKIEYLKHVWMFWLLT